MDLSDKFLIAVLGFCVITLGGRYAFNSYQDGKYPVAQIGSLPKCVLERAQKRLEKGWVVTRHDVRIDRQDCEAEEQQRAENAKRESDLSEQLKAVSRAKE